jgi:hypothetical protein
MELEYSEKRTNQLKFSLGSIQAANVLTKIALKVGKITLIYLRF